MDSKNKTAISSIAGIVLCVLFIPVIVVNLILIISTYTNPDEMPGVFGIKPVIVLSGSMEPEFLTGDMIFLKDVEPVTLVEGDVVCYLEDGSAVTHRIIKIEETDGAVRYVTKGDANNVEDFGTVSPDQIQGRYTGVRLAGVGNLAMFMQSTTGMIICVFCPIVLFLLWDFVKRGKQEKEERERTRKLEQELEALKRGESKEREM